jgi:hypothetical protein
VVYSEVLLEPRQGEEVVDEEDIVGLHNLNLVLDAIFFEGNV